MTIVVILHVLLAVFVATVVTLGVALALCGRGSERRAAEFHARTVHPAGRRREGLR